MANSFTTEQKVANAFLLLLKNALVMGKLVTTKFDKEFTNSEVAVGDTVKVRRPPEYTVRDGRVASAQDVIVGSADVTIDKQKGVDISFTSKEETLSVDELLKDENLKAQASVLAQQIDEDLIAQTLKFPNWVGTPGQTVSTAAKFFAGPQRMDELAIPQEGRAAVLSPSDYWALAATFTGLNASDGTVKTALEKAKLPMLGNCQPYMTQNVVNLTVGTRTASGAATINGADQNVAYADVKSTYKQSLLLKTLTAGHTIKAGEIFTIAGVNAVNPRSKADLGYLQQFVVLADATADGSGLATVSISNPIIISGAYKTCTAAPANGAAVTFLGTASTAYRQNAVFHKGAIALVGAKLVTPSVGKVAFATDPETGISIRYWKTSDGTNDTHLNRCDVLYGTACLDPRLGVRLSG